MTGPEPQQPIGRVVGTHGIKGGLKVHPLTDFIERFEPGSVVVLRGAPRRIRLCSWHRGQARIELEGIEDMTSAESFRGDVISVPVGDRPELDQDEFLATDLVGMEVVTKDGRSVGTLDEVVSSPAHDLFRIGAVLIPVVRQFVVEINLKQRRIVIDPVKGLLPGEDAVEVR